MTDAPKTFGYIRLRNDTDDQELALIENGIIKFAEAHGLRLVHTRYEESPGIAPSRLVRRLIRDDIHHVIVLSLVQITEHPLMQLLILEAITEDGGAAVRGTRDPRVGRRQMNPHLPRTRRRRLDPVIWAASCCVVDE